MESFVTSHMKLQIHLEMTGLILIRNNLFLAVLLSVHVKLKTAIITEIQFEQ